MALAKRCSWVMKSISVVNAASGSDRSDCALLHHLNVISQLNHLIPLMADIDHGELKFRFNMTQGAQDFGASGPIQRGEGFIHEQQSRCID